MKDCLVRLLTHRLSPQQQTVHRQARRLGPVDGRAEPSAQSALSAVHILELGRPEHLLGKDFQAQTWAASAVRAAELSYLQQLQLLDGCAATSLALEVSQRMRHVVPVRAFAPAMPAIRLEK